MGLFIIFLVLVFLCVSIWYTYRYCVVPKLHSINATRAALVLPLFRLQHVVLPLDPLLLPAFTPPLTPDADYLNAHFIPARSEMLEMGGCDSMPDKVQQRIQIKYDSVALGGTV